MQILKARFKLLPDVTTVVDVGSADIQGEIVECSIRTDHQFFTEITPAIMLLGLRSANTECILPYDGIEVGDLGRFPLKLPARPACRIQLSLRTAGAREREGYVFVVVHPVEPPLSPPEYVLSLVPRR